MASSDYKLHPLKFHFVEANQIENNERSIEEANAKKRRTPHSICEASTSFRMNI